VKVSRSGYFAENPEATALADLRDQVVKISGAEKQYSAAANKWTRLIEKFNASIMTLSFSRLPVPHPHHDRKELAIRGEIEMRGRGDVARSRFAAKFWRAADPLVIERLPPLLP